MNRLPIDKLEAILVNKPPGTLLSDRDVEAKWGVKRGHMAELRKRKIGPRYLRLSKRCIRHRPEDIEEYEKQQENAPATSDFKVPASSVEGVESAPPSKKIVRLAAPTGLNKNHEQFQRSYPRRTTTADKTSNDGDRK
jgi:hypothetical protein